MQYKSVPRRSYIDNKIAIKAKKPIKSRFTVMVGTAMDGHKFKPVVIGKSKNPRCFKSLNKEDLPVHYYNSSNAWMTREGKPHNREETYRETL